MTDQLTSSYQEIARAISSEVPSQWNKAWISARVSDDYVGDLVSDYVNRSGEQNWFEIEDADKVTRIAKALVEIRRAMAQPGHKPWSRCTFTLHPDGTFKFDVEYDD